MTDDCSGADGTDGSGRQPTVRPVVGEDEVAALMCREGRRTVDDQNRQQSETDTKANRLLRANLVLVGLILSGVSVASRTDAIAAGPFLNGFSLAGIGLLFASTAGAGLTYTATESRIGVSDETIRHVVGRDVSRAEAERGLAKAYARWIEVNRRSNVENAFYVTVTILLVLAGMVFLVTGAVVGSLAGHLSGGARVALWATGVVVVTGMARLSGVRDDLEEWRAYRTEDQVTGDRTFIRDDGE